MFEYPISPFNNRHALEDRASAKKEFLSRYDVAVRRFKSTRTRGIVFRFFAKILRRSPYLHDLHETKHGLKLNGSHYSGMKVVPIASIIGTEGKASDFDMRFYPRGEKSRERWINVAMEYLCCSSLPPVQLTRIGDAYFVRDGHHRISVARAFGQMSIDAEVVTWNASSPFPWQLNATIENTNRLQHADLSA